jgi:hypothetical protein
MSGDKKYWLNYKTADGAWEEVVEKAAQVHAGNIQFGRSSLHMGNKIIIREENTGILSTRSDQVARFDNKPTVQELVSTITSVTGRQPTGNPAAAGGSSPDSTEEKKLRRQNKKLREENKELQGQLSEMQSQMKEMQGVMEELKEQQSGEVPPQNEKSEWEKKYEETREGAGIDPPDSEFN